MKLPVAFQKQIINFLMSLPNIGDTNSRQALIESAGLDSELQDQISVDEPPAQFVPLLVTRLIKFGKLTDGHHALEAVLEATKNYVGQDKQEYCERLLQELNVNIEKNQKELTVSKTILGTERKYKVRRNIIIIATLFIILIMLFSGWKYFKAYQDHTLGAELNRMGFTELYPPSTLTPPGTVVTLKDNKETLLVVCTVEQAFGRHFMSRILESQSTQTDMARNFSRTFNLDATLLKELIRQNNDGLIQEITLALSNIKILEIPDDAVYEYINDRKISCEQAIDKRESYGQEVSIIKKVFQADAVYNIKYDDKASANIQTQITTELASKLTDKTSITSENSLVSKDLFWGVFDDQILASIRKGQLPPTGSSERKRLLNLHRPLNVEYEEVAYNVKPIQQPSSMACWATVYTMMLSWKENADIEIKDAIQRLGSRWEVYFQRDKGLPPDELSDFIIDTGFAVESPKSYLPSFYVELLKNFGPIWITTGDGFSSHARLLIGAYRSDNENINPITDNLIFEFIDPASGSITRRKFVDFLEEYEKEAVFLLEKRRDLPFRIQIIHWAEF